MVRWNLQRDIPLYAPRFNIAPSQQVPVVGSTDNAPDAKPMQTFTIITTEPNDLMRPIHNRMPVILRREDEEQWLDVSGARFEKARFVLKPYSADQMDAYDVSTVVNKPENDTAECIQPFSGSETLTPQLSLL